jgi:ketosteroid isomerase-like protein
MNVDFAPVNADFFSAEERRDTEALAQCFANDAVVHDEGQSIQGHAAIREWQLETKKKYQHTTKPVACVQRGGKTVVSARLTGNFPGSPVDLQFAFEVEAGKIVSLEIR